MLHKIRESRLAAASLAGLVATTLGMSAAAAQPTGPAPEPLQPPVPAPSGSPPAPDAPPPKGLEPKPKSDIPGDAPGKGKGEGDAKKEAPDTAKPQPSYGGPQPPPHPESLPERKDLKAGQKRKPQDYDGKEDHTTTAEDLLWIPRVVFFPLYLVTEYVIRIPLGMLTVAVERSNLISDLQKAFTFGPDNNIGIIPTAFLDFGFRPSVGIYFFYNDFLTKGNDLRANFGFGGTRFWRAGLADRIPIDTPIGLERARSYFQIETDFLTRADLLYWGIGPDTIEDTRSKLEVWTVGGGGRVHIEPWRGTFLESWVTARYTTTGPGECSGSVTFVDEDLGIGRICDPPTIRRQIEDGVFAIPPGYGRPYVTVKTGVRVALDSRKPRPAPGTGVALELKGEHVADVDEPGLGSWINYSAVLGGFVDLTGKQRVLGLTVAAFFQDPLTDKTTVPLTELVGAKHVEDVPDLDIMRGFPPGRLLGSSAIAATLDYRWPIWAFLDGTLQASVGNTFAEHHLEDFELDKLRFSFLGGIRSPNHRDHSFNLLAGFGTDTFEQGGAPSSFRFLFGGTTGF